MKTLCAVCRVQIRDDGNKDGFVSHGLCECHYQESIKEIERLERIEEQRAVLVESFKAIRPEGRI